MKYTFVGDIHGRWEAVKEALQRDGEVIFVGDFVDSFDRSVDDQEKCLQLVIEAIKRNKAKAIGGIFWCDFNQEFVPIKGINQIFGHTGYDNRNKEYLKGSKIRLLKGIDSENYCIDCLDRKQDFLQLEI